MSGLSTTQAGKSGPYYELTVIYAPRNAANVADVVNTTIAQATKAGFEVCTMEIDGKKTLAYPVRDEDGKEHAKGVFAYFTLSGCGRAFELSRTLDADNQVLRYLLVKAVDRNSKGVK